MKSTIISNYIYNLTFQFVSLAIPLITTPYLSRVLGADGIGTFSYHYSIISLFSLFIILGLTNYGSRSIAQCLEDSVLRSKRFTELFTMQVILGFLVIIVYVLFSFTLENIKISLLLLPVLLASTFDVAWYLYGREKFKVVSLIGVSLKVLSAICFFTFVKSADDVAAYAIIMALSTVFYQIVALPIVFKEAKLVKIKISDIKKHIKPNLVLFIPIVAVSIYRTTDKIMLGAMTDMFQVGYFENAEKIISLLVGVVAALGTVMMPRMTTLYQEDNTMAIKTIMKKSIVFIAVVSSVITFGVLSVSHDLVIWFLGNNFEGSISILILLCLTVPFLSFANILRTQILIPQGKDKPFVVSSIVGAVINLLVNIILIPKYGAKGAAIATIFAECSVFAIQYLLIRKEVDFGGVLPTIAGVYSSGAVMMIVLFLLRPLLHFSLFMCIVVEVLIGAIIYGILLLIQMFIFKDRALNMILQNLKSIRII